MMADGFMAVEHYGVGDGAEPIHDRANKGEGGEIKHGFFQRQNFLAIQDPSNIMINLILDDK